MKRFPVILWTWFLACALCAAVVALGFERIDMPVALFFWRAGRVLRPLNELFGAAVILSLEAAVILALALARVLRGHLSRFAEALVIACLTSICAYGINGHVLKVFFGVPNPAHVILHGARHTFRLLRGSSNSSFPSGHMVLAGSFSGVFMRLYRASVWPLCALLLLAAGLLIVGGWHFVSDIAAGTFVGLSAGMLAGESWSVHTVAQAKPRATSRG